MKSLQSFLNQLKNLPEQHARFLNTLSMLEYVGARKILKSQPLESISSQVLAHAAEEIRHAQLFKKMALKLSNGTLNSYQADHLFCGDEAWAYFQSIDYGVAQALNQPEHWANYLLTTLLIEERANAVYPFYDEILSELGFPGALKALIREEDAHLQDVWTELKKKNYLSEELQKSLKALEEDAFGRLVYQFQSALETARERTG